MDEDTDLLEPIAGQATVSFSNLDLLEVPVNDLNPQVIQSSLAPLADLEAAQTCTQVLTTRPIHDLSTARSLIEAGLSRISGSIDAVENEVRKQVGEGEWGSLDKSQVVQALQRALASDAMVKSSFELYSHLQRLSQLLDTFTLLTSPASSSTATEAPTTTQATVLEEGDDVVIDDPWAEAEDQTQQSEEIEDPWESQSANSAKSTTEETPPVKHTNSVPFPIPLSIFLAEPLPDSAADILSAGDLRAFETVYQRHTTDLFPYRFDIIESLPPWISPVKLEASGILPKVGADGCEPTPSPSFNSFSDFGTGLSSLATITMESSPARSVEDLRAWYTSRVEAIDTLGLLDMQLAWVSQASTLGVQGLEVLYEDLSLLARLVYDAHLTPKEQSEWTLESWRVSSPESIVKAYISNADEESIVEDVRRLVLPYLYVLESRAERAGEDSSNLVERHLHNIILDLPLNLALPLFSASKATVPSAERIIKDDMTVARLALACLYGSNASDSWMTMSAIFECLPVWDVSGGDADSDQEATAMTLDSIATFVRPNADAPPPTAPDLFIFFSPLPFASLSRALDILDVHLESGEILARWNTPVQLRFLLQSARNQDDQRELAEKMVRRQVSGPHTNQRWTTLWDDMLRLSGGNDALLRGAFGVLPLKDMMRIYIGGVLASGSASCCDGEGTVLIPEPDIARKAIQRLKGQESWSDAMLQDAVLQVSREFYGKAESGNLHTGDMKLAYDW